MKGRKKPDPEPGQKPIRKMVVANGEQLQDAISDIKRAWNNAQHQPQPQSISVRTITDAKGVASPKNTVILLHPELHNWIASFRDDGAEAHRQGKIVTLQIFSVEEDKE